MHKVKLAIVAIFAILMIIIIAQNTETVATQILFLTIEMPRAILLALTLAVGFVLGLLVSFSMSQRKKAQD